MAERGEYSPESATRTADALTSFAVDDLDLTAVLFQTGYLTLASYHERRRHYRLEYPNYEVREAFERHLLAAMTGAPAGTARLDPLLDALEAGDVAGVIAAIDATLASIPYPLWQSHAERTYHMIVHVLFRAVGAHHRSEVATAGGRADVVVATDAYVYAFEFKVGGTAAGALAQIRDRGYLLPYADDERMRISVGVVFDPARRQVGEWVHEVV